MPRLDDANKAITSFSGRVMGGRRLTVNESQDDRSHDEMRKSARTDALKFFIALEME